MNDFTFHSRKSMVTERNSIHEIKFNETKKNSVPHSQNQPRLPPTFHEVQITRKMGVFGSSANVFLIQSFCLESFVFFFHVSNFQFTKKYFQEKIKEKTHTH